MIGHEAVESGAKALDDLYDMTRSLRHDSLSLARRSEVVEKDDLHDSSQYRDSGQL